MGHSADRGGGRGHLGRRRGGVSGVQVLMGHLGKGRERKGDDVWQ